MGLSFDKKVTLGDIIQLGLILAAMLLGWYKLDYRVGSLEWQQTQTRVQFVQMSATLDNLNTTLSKLNGQLIYFPPHVHIGNEIIYPDGRREVDQSQAQSQSQQKAR